MIKYREFLDLTDEEIEKKLKELSKPDILKMLENAK